MLKKPIFLCYLAVLAAFNAQAIDISNTRLLQQPAISNKLLAFVYDNDIWISKTDGSNPRRLTANPTPESWPKFSPDGQWLAFSGNYDGNFDVYIVQATGGVPRRLTWHPAPDKVLGWTADSQVIFTSQRNVTTRRHSHVYTIGIGDQFPKRMPVPSAFRVSVSPDSKRMAYVPVNQAFTQWKNYRGGTHSRILIVDFDDLKLTRIPQPKERANDSDPMWLNNTIYFLSDRNGEFNLFAYDINSGKISQKTRFKHFPAINASANGNTIVFEQAGYLFSYNTAKEELQQLKIGISADLRQLRTAR